jgi:hypothetical protein
VIDIQEGREENSYVWEPSHVESEDAKVRALQTVMEAREAVEDSSEYKDIEIKLEEMNQDENEESTRKRQTKRRRIMKGLRLYTGKKNETERSYRGWSSRAYTEMIKRKDEIADDKERRRRFCMAVRRVLHLNQDSEEDNNNEAGKENEAPVKGLYDDIPTCLENMIRV